MKRRPGTNPLLETRAESEKSVDKPTFYSHILKILKDSETDMTAREIAEEMKNRGYSNSSERQTVAPRITELLQMGKLENVGTRLCSHSNKTVGTFEIRKER